MKSGKGRQPLKSRLLGGGMLLCLMVPAAYAQDVREDEIVVTATRSEKSLLEVPAAVSSQNMDKLRQQGFTYGTDEFRGVPGVYFRRGEGDGDEFPFVSIRGVTGNHGNDTFLALIDGIPFVGPDEEVMLYQVPYSAVERVEIVRGPSSALYGRGAISGAVNYLTRTPKSDAARVALSAGGDNYYRGEATVERALDQGGFVISGSYEDSKGWREHSARQVANVFGKADWLIGENTKLSAYLNYIDRESEVPGAIPTLADGTVLDVAGGRKAFLGYGDTHNQVEGWLGALRLEHEFSPDLSVSVTAHARHFDTDNLLNFYDPWGLDPSRNIMAVNGFGSRGDQDVLFGEAVINWKPVGHNILIGASAEQTKQKEVEFWSGQYGFTFDCGFAFYLIEINYRTGAVANGGHSCFVNNQLQADTDARNQFWSLFVQDEISLTDRLTLTLGGRYDAFDRDVTFGPTGPFSPGGKLEGSSDSFSPKAALSWRQGAGQFYAAYGRGFSSNFGPIWQWDPTQYARTEKPTTIDSYEIGWKGRALDNRLTVETALFHLIQKNRRVLVSNPDPLGPPNLATTGQRYESSGFEGALDFRVTDTTSISGTYTWIKAEWDEFLLNGADYSGSEAQGVPEHFFTMAVEQRFTPSLRARVGYEWYGDYHITLDNARRDGAYGLLLLSATLDVTDNVAVDLSVTNALDKKYYGYFGNETDVTHATPGVPRQFRATLRGTF